MNSSNLRRTTTSKGDSPTNFFNSKTFLILVVIAIAVVLMAIFSSMNNRTEKPNTNGDNYHIDTSNLENDSSAQGVIPTN